MKKEYEYAGLIFGDDLKVCYNNLDPERYNKRGCSPKSCRQIL